MLQDSQRQTCQRDLLNSIRAVAEVREMETAVQATEKRQSDGKQLSLSLCPSASHRSLPARPLDLVPARGSHCPGVGLDLQSPGTGTLFDNGEPNPAAPAGRGWGGL